MGTKRPIAYGTPRKCKIESCNNTVTKDKHGQYKKYCSDECKRMESKRPIPYGTPRKCQKSGCENFVEKDKYGAYKPYCSDECKIVGFKESVKKTYENKSDSEMEVILEKRKATVLENYKVDNVSKTQAVKDQIKETKLLKHGDENYNNRELAIQTCLKNHGVEHSLSSQEVRDLGKITLLEKYGYDHPLKVPDIAASVSQKNTENARERMAKTRKTMLENHGVEFSIHSEKCRTLMKETCLERYGTENAMQNPDVADKCFTNQFRKKDYVMPSGKIVQYMGYENFAIDGLLGIYDEDEIITESKDKPRIEYFSPDNTKHYYFPDLYVPKDNLVIEVKSLWTYCGQSEWLALNLRKRDATIKAGYNFIFTVYDKDGNLIDIDNLE